MFLKWNGQLPVGERMPISFHRREIKIYEVKLLISSSEWGSVHLIFSVFSDKKKVGLSAKIDEGSEEVWSLKTIKKFYTTAVETRKEVTREI